MDQITSDRVYTGTVTFTKPAALAAGTVTAANIAAAAGIETSKAIHRHRAGVNQVGTAVSATIPLFSIASSVGATIVSVRVWSVAANVGNSTVTVDIKKNGTSILSAVVTLNSGVAAYTPTLGTISTAAGVQNDCYTAVVVATVGTGTLATGLCIGVTYDEAPA